MDESSVPLSELTARIHRFQQALQANAVDAALILQNTDLYYFSGTIQQSFLFIPAQGEAILMTRKSFERAIGESALPIIVPLKSPKDVPCILSEHGIALPGRLGLELDVLPVQLYQGIGQIFHDSKLVDVSHVIRTVRSVKSEYELGLIAEAARFSDQVFSYISGICREGMTEVALAGAIEGFARTLGHQGTVRMRLWGSEMFYGHLMAGPDAATPSFLASPTGGKGLSAATAQGASFHRIGRHQPILIDYVFAWKGYLADQTRIFSIGPIADELIRAHEDMLLLEDEIMDWIRPGISAGSVYEKAIDWTNRKGYADNFMGNGDQRVRFIGHGVGLELDEYPFFAKGQQTVVQEDMVVAIEPKLIFPGNGVVGIENTFRVTAKGLVPFTQFPGGIQLL